MRGIVAMGLILGLGGLVFAAAPTRPQNGYWKPESVQHEGKEQIPSAKDRELLTLVLVNHEYRMYYLTDPKEGKAIKLFLGDFRPDPASNTFELEVKEGQRKGLRVHGIYEVTGNQMKLCYGPIDKPRPTKFEAPAGSGLFNEVWTYMNPQPKPAK